YRLAENLSRVVTQETLGGRIPGGDGSIPGFTKDGVTCGFDNRRQQPLSCCGLLVDFGRHIPQWRLDAVGIHFALALVTDHTARVRGSPSLGVPASTTNRRNRWPASDVGLARDFA